MNIIEEIREYIAFADHLLLEAVRDGSISIEDAKKNAAETEKWREKLAILEGREVAA
jgi:hypothetical protein